MIFNMMFLLGLEQLVGRTVKSFDLRPWNWLMFSHWVFVLHLRDWSNDLCMLRCALCCVALRCTALHCSALRCTALHYTTLHYTILYCTTLHYTTLHYTILHYTPYHTILYSSHSSLINLGCLKDHFFKKEINKV